MTNYQKIKKLDLESLDALTDGVGPSDECICNLLSPPDGKRGLSSMGASIKKAFRSLSGGKKGYTARGGGTTIDVPLTFTKGGNGIFTTKEVVKRTSPCGKCSCDSKNVVMKHSFANIRIISPDVSSICPCPTDCLPNMDKLNNNIKVTVERVDQMTIDPDMTDSEFSLHNVKKYSTSEPVMEKRSVSELIDAEYEDNEGRNENEDGNGIEDKNRIEDKNKSEDKNNDNDIDDYEYSDWSFDDED